MAITANVTNGKLDKTNTTPTQNRKTSSAKASGSNLGYDDFLKLLSAEMQYQDPLESTLHKELNDRRVNKINSRKEFFNVTLDEIEALVYKYQPTAEFNRTMLAEEYRQGLSMTEALPEVSDFNSTDDIDE